MNVDVYDPQADSGQVVEEYGIQLSESYEGEYDAIILAVAHKEFLELDWEKIRKGTPIIYDVKSVLSKELVDGRL